MQNINGFRILSYVKDTECASGISDANLASAATCDLKWLPVIRQEPCLDSAKLKAGFAFRFNRQSKQILVC